MTKHSMETDVTLEGEIMAGVRAAAGEPRDAAAPRWREVPERAPMRPARAPRSSAPPSRSVEIVLLEGKARQRRQRLIYSGRPVRLQVGSSGDADWRIHARGVRARHLGFSWNGRVLQLDVLAPGAAVQVDDHVVQRRLELQCGARLGLGEALLEVALLPARRQRPERLGARRAAPVVSTAPASSEAPKVPPGVDETLVGDGPESVGIVAPPQRGVAASLVHAESGREARGPVVTSATPSEKRSPASSSGPWPGRGLERARASLRAWRLRLGWRALFVPAALGLAGGAGVGATIQGGTAAASVPVPVPATPAEPAPERAPAAPIAGASQRRASAPSPSGSTRAQRGAGDPHGEPAPKPAPKPASKPASKPAPRDEGLPALGVVVEHLVAGRAREAALGYAALARQERAPSAYGFMAKVLRERAERDCAAAGVEGGAACR